MLKVFKMDGATSTAGAPKRGSKGCLELYADVVENGYEVRFVDYGNYGRVRWEANFGTLDDAQLESLVASLNALREGRVATTRSVQSVVVEVEVVEAVAVVPTEEQTTSEEERA